MITKVEGRWRGSKIVILSKTCNKNEPPWIRASMARFVFGTLARTRATFWESINRECEH